MPHRKFSQLPGSRPNRVAGVQKLKPSRVFSDLVKEISDLLKQSSINATWSACQSPPESSVAPKKSKVGADVTICHQIPTFSNSTGLTGGSSIVAIPTTNTLGSISLEMADFPDSAAWLSNWDQYRFEKLHFRFSPYSNTSNLVGSTTAATEGSPRLYVAMDRDDSSAPASVAAVQNRGDVKSAMSYMGITKEFIPAVTPSLYASGAFSGYSVIPSNMDWIDSANGAVPAYGVKFAVEALPTGSTEFFAWKVDCWATVSFKNNL